MNMKHLQYDGNWQIDKMGLKNKIWDPQNKTAMVKWPKATDNAPRLKLVSTPQHYLCSICI